MWWACATITTVGYGDRYPITTEGRIVGVVLMTVGVGLFGTFTGFVASWFLQNLRVRETEKTEEEERLSVSSTDLNPRYFQINTAAAISLALDGNRWKS